MISHISSIPMISIACMASAHSALNSSEWTSSIDGFQDLSETSAPHLHTSGEWHESPIFWRLMGQKMFTEKRWQAAEQEVDQLINLTGLPPGAQILDLCCGSGRHALAFAKRGFVVTGVDRTRYYLAKAREEGEIQGISVEFI